MAKQLIVISGGDKGRSFPLPDSGSLSIGRSKETDTQLSDARVSRKHCQVDVRGEQILLVASQMDNATFVNNQRVQEHQLTSGDVIRVGQTELRFEDEDAAEAKTIGGDTLEQMKAAAHDGGDLSRLVGTTLGPYRVESVLAPGRSGLVFKATDPAGSPVALKVLRPEAARTERDRQRVVQAAQQFVPLRHANLLSVHAAGISGTHCWVAVEYVDGHTLVQDVERAKSAGPRDWRAAVQIVLPLARALDYLHKNDMLHRNIMPRSVLVANSDRAVKLGGLSQACRISGSAALVARRSEEILRDMEFLPPERIREDNKGDERADIYMLGATLFALLTGKPPFEGKTSADLATQVLGSAPVRSKEFEMLLPDALQQAVFRMLAKRPEDRYRSAADVVADLERIAGSAEAIRATLPAAPAPTVLRRAAPGTRGSIAAAYEVLDEIGRGDNGVVYRAQDLALKRQVAVKELNEAFRNDPRQAQQFWEEAQFLASIEHDNIVKIYGIDRERGWLIMELMRGNVGKKLAEGPLPPDLVRSVLRQALEGLDFLHRQNKLHGAVKPTNLLINTNGRVKLSDPAGLSLAGEVQKPKGHMKYVAPEMLNTEFGSVGPGVDLYCLGFTALELLKGPGFESLFKGVGPAAIDSELGWLRLHGSRSEQLPKTLEVLPEAVPADLAKVIDRLLAKDVSARYPSAAAALDDLKDGPLLLFKDEPEANDESAAPAVEEPPPWSRAWINSRLEKPTVYVPLLAAFGVLMMFILFYNSGPDAPKRPRGPGPWTAPKYALLVGVEDYGKELPPVAHADADVAELGRLLAMPGPANGGFDPANVVVLGPHRGDTLQPTAANIRHHLQDLAAKRKPSDSILLALVGHIVQFRDDETNYFCPAGANLNDKATLVPLKEIYDALAQWQGGHNVVLIDSGRSPPGLPPAKREIDLANPQKMEPPKGTVVLFSCGPGQRSYANLEVRHGEFMYEVLRALRGHADGNRDRRVSLEELDLYVPGKVNEYVTKALGQSQFPRVAGKKNGRTFLIECGEPVFSYYNAVPGSQQGPWDDAYAYSNQLLQRVQFLDAILLRGRAQYYLGKYQPAIADFTRTLELDPGNADAYAGRAEARLSDGKIEPALQDIRKAIDLDPLFAPFYSIRAQILTEDKKFDEALKEHDVAISKAPGLARLYLARGRTYLKAGNLDKALKDFEHAKKLAPDDPAPPTCCGLVYEGQKDYDKAIQALNSAVKIDESYGPAFYHRARVHIARGDDRRAARDQKQARELNFNPDLPDPRGAPTRLD